MTDAIIPIGHKPIVARSAIATGVLELSVPAVKTRLHRARQALKELLDRQISDRLEASTDQGPAPLVQSREEIDHEMS